MKLSLRFVVPLLMALCIIALFLMPLIDRLTLRWFQRDLDMRGKLILNSTHDPLIKRLKENKSSEIFSFLNKITLDDRLMAIGYCNKNDSMKYKTSLFPSDVACN